MSRISLKTNVIQHLKLGSVTQLHGCKYTLNTLMIKIMCSAYVSSSELSSTSMFTFFFSTAPFGMNRSSMSSSRSSSSIPNSDDPFPAAIGILEFVLWDCRSSSVSSSSSCCGFSSSAAANRSTSSTLSSSLSSPSLSVAEFWQTK